MKPRSWIIVALAGTVATGLALPVQAQEDNTGTNPVNFTYDFRLYAEMASLPIDDSSLITNTVELRWPFGRDVANLKGVGAGSVYYDMGSRFGTRVRARYSNLSVDVPGSGTFSVSGIGASTRACCTCRTSARRRSSRSVSRASSPPLPTTPSGPAGPRSGRP